MSKSIGATSVAILMLWGGAVAVGDTIQWSQVNSLPSATGWAGAAVVDGKVYVAGGNPVPQGSPWAYNSLRIYDPATQAWSSGPSMVYSRYGLGSGVITAPNGQKEMYAVGGYTGGAGSSYVERFVPSTGAWETVASVDRPMEGAMVAVVNNQLYALGGFSNGSNPYSMNSVYDREHNTWVPKAAITKHGSDVPLRRSLTAVWGSKILLFGGSSSPSIDASRYTMIYDTLTDTWSTGADIPQGHAIGATFVWGDRIYLLGGGGTVLDVYSPLTNSWSTAEGYPGAQQPFAAQDGNRAYVFNHMGGPEVWMGVVPEPATLSLLALGGLAVMRRKRR